MVRNHECKMVVLLATALALGAGAIAACVIPWFYCKPPDADDENREATGIRNVTDPGSHFQSNVDENLNPTPNIRINGISYVRVVVPRNSSLNQSTMPTSAMLNSATLNPLSPQDFVEENATHPVNAHNVCLQPLRNVDPMITGLTNSGVFEELSRNVDNAIKFNNSKILASKSDDSQPSESDFRISGVSNSGISNPEIVGVRVLIKNDGNPPAQIPDNETTNPTDGSTTEPTITTSSASSELLNPDSIRPYDAVTESKGILSSITESNDPESSALASSTRNEERSSTTLTTSDPSSPTDESTTETTNKTSTSQKSEYSSSGPTKVLTIAVVEASDTSDSPETIREMFTLPTANPSTSRVEFCKISDTLETIQEISTTPAATPPPKISLQSRFNRTPYPWMGNEESIISTSTRTFNHNGSRSNLTPLIPENLDSTRLSLKRQNAGNRKTSRGSRYVEALSGRIKKIWRGIKTTPRHGRNKYDQQTDSIKSLSAGKKRPTGHSTLISEDQRLLDTIRTRRSPKALTPVSLKIFDNPEIVVNDIPNCVPQFCIEGDEEPLDLSIRSSSERGNDKTADVFSGKTRMNRSADSCKKVFRDVAEYLKVRKSSKSSEDVISVSDSLVFSSGTTKKCLKDENQNVRSESGGQESDHQEKLDRRCLPKSNRFPRSIKKILHIGSKDRSKGHKLSSPMHQEQLSNSAPIECVEKAESTSSKLKNELNVKVICTPDSCTDMSSYFELAVAKSDDDRYLDEPCTEL